MPKPPAIDETPVGIHRQMSEAEYFAIDAFNHSLMDYGLRSMAHLKAQMEQPEELDTAAMRLGSAVHLAVFEPARIAAGEVVYYERHLDLRKNADKEYKARFDEENAGRIILSDPDDYSYVVAMRDSLAKNERARKLVQTVGPMEAVAVWEDAETGLRCKAKLDKFIPGVLALDLKTTANASKDAFGYMVNKHGYHRQAAHYIDGFEALTGEETPFVFVAVENTPPHAVGMYSLDVETISVGRSQNRRILRQIAECKKTGVWPGYPDKVEELSLPSWALKLDEGGLVIPVDDSHGF